MDDAPHGYELWDWESGNLINVYDTLDEALALVRRQTEGLSDPDAADWVSHLVLAKRDAGGSFGEVIAEELELLKLARGETP